MIVLTPLHTSEATAYTVEDYPYGFRLRCRIRYWIETTAHGQRICSQTTNPKRGNVWNKPKKSTYSELVVLYVDEATGHVEHEGLSAGYSDEDKIASFVDRFSAALTDERSVKTIQLLRAVARAQKNVKVTVRALAPGELPQSAEEQARIMRAAVGHELARMKP